MELKLVVLDVNGTLFPLEAVGERLAAVGLDGELEVWFTRILRDGFAATAAGTFVAFPEMARHHLSVLLRRHGAAVTDHRLDHVLEGFTEVRAHGDVAPGLERLRAAGVTVVTMTNGTVEITREFLRREDLDGLVAATYDVAMVGRWKPNTEPYHHVVEEHGLRTTEAALIAVHPWDVQGAIQAGLVGAWVNRDGRWYPPTFTAPDVEADSFDTVVEQLLVRGAAG